MCFETRSCPPLVNLCIVDLKSMVVNTFFKGWGVLVKLIGVNKGRRVTMQYRLVYSTLMFEGVDGTSILFNLNVCCCHGSVKLNIKVCRSNVNIHQCKIFRSYFNQHLVILIRSYELASIPRHLFKCTTKKIFNSLIVFA